MALVISSSPISQVEIAVLPTALADLFHPATKAETAIRLRGGMTIQAPYYAIHEERVWGATAMIISELEAVFAAF